MDDTANGTTKEYVKVMGEVYEPSGYGEGGTVRAIRKVEGSPVGLKLSAVTPSTKLLKNQQDTGLN